MDRKNSGAVARQFHFAVVEKKDAKIAALRAERDELLAAGKLALSRLCDGCYFETRDCPGNPEGCEAVRTLRAAIKRVEHE